MIQNILLRVNVHATEEISKVEKAIGFFLLSDVIDIKKIFDSSFSKMNERYSLNQKLDNERIEDSMNENHRFSRTYTPSENMYAEIDYTEIINKSLKDKIELMHITGHYKNQITIISAKLTRKSEISSFFNHIKRNISYSEQETLISDIPNRLDENQILHLRFDKQAAFLGKIHLTENSDAISVRIKIVTYPKNRNSAIIEAGELFDRKFL